MLTSKVIESPFGRLTRFTVPLDFRCTDFQRRIWAALVAILYGETRSYGEIARTIGRPGASRAVVAATRLPAFAY